MEFFFALLPGAITGLLGFGGLVVVAGNFLRRRFQHGWKLLTSYALVLGLLWVACGIGGATIFWPLIQQNGHAALVVFLIPYVVVTLPVAGIALLKYGSDMLSTPASASPLV